MQILPIIADREAEDQGLAAWPAPARNTRIDKATAFARRYRAYVLPLLYAASAARHWRLLSRLWNAPGGSLLAATVQARPEIWSMLRVRFVSARWTTRERLNRIIDHCRVCEHIGTPFDIRPTQLATLLTLDELGLNIRLTLDSPRWLLREGLLALSLFDGPDRIFSLSFTLSAPAGLGIVYVGGIQGRRAPDALERNRMLTKAAAGARPQDLLVEMFRTLCEAAGVDRILCVSNGARNGQTAFSNHAGDYADPVKFDYDALWRERGGTLLSDGFFDLPLHVEPRDDSEMPSKRRQARRRKLALIAGLQQRLVDALSRANWMPIVQIEPE